MNLSELIDTHRGARSYSELSRDCGGAPTDKRLQQMVRSSIKNFPDPPTISALSRGLKVPEAEIVLAAAESLGLDVRRPRPRLFDLLPDTIDALTEEQASAVAHLIRAFTADARAAREVQRRRSEPTVAGVLAAQQRAAQPEPADSRSLAKTLYASAYSAERVGVLDDIEQLATEMLHQRGLTQREFNQVSYVVAERRHMLTSGESPFGTTVLHATRLGQYRLRIARGDVLDAEEATDHAWLESWYSRQPDPKPIIAGDPGTEAPENTYAIFTKLNRPDFVYGQSVDAPAAARTGTRRRSITDRAQNEAGEHNQDLGGMDAS